MLRTYRPLKLLELNFGQALELVEFKVGERAEQCGLAVIPLIGIEAEIGVLPQQFGEARDFRFAKMLNILRDSTSRELRRSARLDPADVCNVRIGREYDR